MLEPMTFGRLPLVHLYAYLVIPFVTLFSLFHARLLSPQSWLSYFSPRSDSHISIL